MKTIVNAKIITDKEVLEGYCLSFDEKIVSLTQDVPKESELIDAKGLICQLDLLTYIFMVQTALMLWMEHKRL